MSKYVIFGGAGFVGVNLVKKLAGEHDIVVADNLAYTQEPNLAALRAIDGVQVVEGDVRDESLVNDLVGSGTAGVFHLASLVGIKNYLRDPLGLIDTNILGTRNVAKSCVQHGVKMLYTSTSEVLGRNEDVPWGEDADRVYGAATVDRWAYGASKGVSEQMLNAMHRQLGLHLMIVRFFNVYGPFQRPYFVASKTLYHYLRDERPLKYDSGNQTRCFTFIEDAIDAVLALFKRGVDGETYHIGSQFEYTIDEFIDLTRQICGSALLAQPWDTAVQYGEVYEDISRRVPNVSKILSHVNWRATTPVEDGMIKFRKWALANRWWLDLHV